jgi:hypothetical protein
MAAIHGQRWIEVHRPPLSLGRRRRAARLRRELTEVDGFLDELHGDLEAERTTLVRALERYRSGLRSAQGG